MDSNFIQNYFRQDQQDLLDIFFPGFLRKPGKAIGPAAAK